MSLDLDNLQDAYILSFYSSLDCPRSLACWLMYSQKEHLQLARLSFDPLDYNDYTSLSDSLAATKFLAKAEFLQTGLNLPEEAKAKFLECEQHCATVNNNIRRNRYKNIYSAGILSGAARKIERLLGKVDADEFLNACNWGPGATTLLPRRLASNSEKFSVERKITADAYHFVKDWFHIAFPHWEMVFEIDPNAKVITVPKDAKTDRTIAIEPGLNLFFQKGIGTLLRKRLRNVGIDLNSQRHNQELARLGSKFNHLATVDFSSASDTISNEIVKQLLPSSWYSLLKAFKSNSGLFGKELIVFEKFSSMGNGFTFELESLIFYVIAVCVCEQLDLENPVVSVYGDDVILPSIACDLFYDVSADLGFTVNRSKSYTSGDYRESCGEHFYRGARVKPIFQKEALNGQTAVLKAANSVRRLANRRNYYGCDARLRACWQLLVRYLGAKAPRISEGYGDLGIIENFDESRDHAVRAKHGVEGYLVRVWAVQAVQRYVDSPGLLLSKLKAIESSRTKVNFLTDLGDASSIGSEIGNNLPMPGRIRYAKIRVSVPVWHDLGPWV